MLLLRALSQAWELLEDSRCVIWAGGFAAFCAFVAVNPPSLPEEEEEEEDEFGNSSPA